jgi:hypothetical protein
MRERIDTNDAVLALGNWLNRRDDNEPRWLTRLRLDRPEGYDMYAPCDMKPEDILYYFDVVRLAWDNPYVRIMELPEQDIFIRKVTR